jgi:hypothetical protein
MKSVSEQLLQTAYEQRPMHARNIEYTVYSQNMRSLASHLRMVKSNWQLLLSRSFLLHMLHTKAKFVHCDCDAAQAAEMLILRSQCEKLLSYFNSFQRHYNYNYS